LRAGKQNAGGLEYKNGIVSYHLEEAGETQLDLYDLSGKLVRRLCGGRSGAGTHSIVLEKSGMPAGTYVVCLRSSGSGEVKKKIPVIR
jgi:hypothetical protein